MLRLDRPAFDFSDRGVSGPAPPGPAQAFVATERGIYRPGETVHATALLRDRLGDAIDDQTLTLVLTRPDGVEARRITEPATPGGGSVGLFRLSDSAGLGTWRISAETDQTAGPIGGVSFEVQDFVPELLAVALHPASPSLVPNVASSATVDGRFLYGAPAAGLHGEMTLVVERDPDPVPGAKGFSFGLAGERIEVPQQTIKIPPVSAGGSGTVAFTPVVPGGLTSPLRAVLTATLFEPGGRGVQDGATLPIRGTRMLIGLKGPGPGAASSRDLQTAPIQVATFSPSGAPVAAHGLHWAVIRENRIYDWFERNGSWTFHTHVIDEPILNGTLETNASGIGRIEPSLDWGNYRVVVSSEGPGPDQGATSSIRFDTGYADWDHGPDSPDKLRVSVRDRTLRPGARTIVHVDAAFAGHAQLTLASSRIFETRMIEVGKGGTDIPVTADARWGAGAYALVTLYRPLMAPARPHDPVRAVGLAWIGLDQSAHTLSVSLHAPARIVPRRRLVVPVEVAGGGAGPSVRLTLAAVDEGILRITRFATPDPLSSLFGRRRLGLDMRDDYGRLLDGTAQLGAIHEGGDESGGKGLPVVSSKIVSLFSGPVTLDSSGRGTVALEIPDFEGQLRLMAIAWSQHAVGRAQADVTVRDPVFADVALPRFLAPGDDARVAVSVADTDAPSGRYHLGLATSGPVRIEGQSAFDVTLARGGRVQLAANLVGGEVGIGTVTATLKRIGDDARTLSRSWQIAVRPGHFPTTVSRSETQPPGGTYTVDPAVMSGYLPGDVSVTVGYSGFPGIDTVGLLQSLVGENDWTCSEQLASGAWPLLFFNDPGLLGRLPLPGGIRGRVQHAVDTLLDREDPAGRFGLWRVNDGAATPWLDVYVVDFLVHARDFGFEVPQASLDRAVEWLDEEQVQGFGDFSRNQEEVPQSRAYALYVLARAGRASPGAIRRMHDDAWSRREDGVELVYWGGPAVDATLSEPLSMGHLAAALRLTGDTEGAAGAFGWAVGNLGAERIGRASWFDVTYWTYVRDLAGLVSLSAEAGDDALAHSLVARFDRMTLTPPLLNDQEKAALLGAAHALDRDEPGRALAVNGTKTGTLHLPAAFSPDPSMVRRGYTLANVGSVALWRTLTVHGTPAAAPPAASNGYTLDRKQLTLDGQPVDPARLHQNDRLLVELHGEASNDDDHRSVIVDMLPAGWEIESTIRSPSDRRQYPFLGALTRARSIEARDDRLVAAFDLGADLDPPTATELDDDDAKDRPVPLKPGEFRIAYIVRVTTPGHFVRPETVVTDMYRPTLLARTLSETIDVAAAQ